MKKYFSMAMMMVAVGFMATFTSCDLLGEDDAKVNIDDLLGGGGSVPDGVYIIGTAVSTDTTDANLLIETEVAAPDFQTQERPGLYSGYIYMKPGSFTFLTVDGETISAAGGSWTEATLGDLAYAAGTLSANGVATIDEGEFLAHVVVDYSTMQYYIIPVEYWEVIGTATEGGWSTGTEISQVSVTADEVKFESTGVVLRGPNTEFKIRYNSIWNLDLDAEECDESVEACLNFNTNFGGTLDELVSGGSNFSFVGGEGVDGVFTMTITYTPGEGNSLAITMVRTGDAAEITFDPTAYAFGLIGDATAGGWDSDQDLLYKGNVDGAYTWLGVVTFGATGNYKFRTNDSWDFNLGGDLAALSIGGADLPTPGEGAYYVKISTADEGATWTSTVTAGGWGVIGTGSPQGNWDADMDMTAAGFAEGVTTYTITGDFTADAWKFRAGDAWDYNLGGALDGLTPDGADLTLATAGTYIVTLSFDGSNYTATAEKQ